jgi:CHAT domain-containing protein/tetratricopeptide (TPR) repeat protein
MILLCKKVYVFSILFLLCLNTAKGQQIDVISYYNHQVESEEFTIQQEEKLLDSLLKLPNSSVDTLQLVKIYRTFVKRNYYSDVNKALFYADAIDKIANALNNFELDDFKRNYRNQINLLYNDQKYYKVIQAASSYLERYPVVDESTGKIYRLLGKAYNDLGDYQKALVNYDESIYKIKPFENSKELTRTDVSKLETLVNLYDKSYAEEIIYLEKELESIQKIGKISYTNLYGKHLNLGVFYEQIYKDKEKAIYNYEKGLELSIKEGDTADIVKSYNNLGGIYKNNDQFQKAKEYLNKAENLSGEYPLLTGMVYNNLADVYKEENNHEEALIHYQKAITEALQIDALPYQKLPDFDMIYVSPNKSDILGYLIDKANGWMSYYESEDKAEYLQNALDTFTLADELIGIIYVESREDLSKLFWRKKGATFYPKAVEVCYRLQQPENAFSFMEKNKAMLLLENMTNATAKRLSKLPENILEREQKLIKAIKTLESEIQTSPRNVDTLKTKVFSYKEAYSAFIDSLETSYPKYYNYKKNINIVTLPEVQNNLQNDELVLQYIVGKENGFVALISNTAIQLKALPTTKQLTKIVTAYKKAVSNPFLNQEDQKMYETLATQLYKQLIPFDDSTVLSQKKITIIADDLLQYIPFESLRSSQNDYLIEKAQIQYGYSLSSSAQSKQNKTPISKNFIAIAPTEFKDQQFGKLATSGEELKKLSGIFNANHFQYEKATKGRFSKAYGNYKIIHLSTHGGIDNTVPWIAFYDEKMTLDELYFTKNQSELVVLSACKTSDGELKKGEGVMSLARGFFNAGAKSIISSLWDINEKASNDIIQEFYKNIAEGDTKSLALQKAKLTYIQTHKNTSEASPYYWSALTLTGDISPIDTTEHSYLYYILGGILLTGIIIFLRKTQHQKPNT